MRKEKVYEVTFVDYADEWKGSVRSDVPDEKGGFPYLEVPMPGRPFLVKESDLERFRRFGGGYESVRLAGAMYFPDPGEGEASR